MKSYRIGFLTIRGGSGIIATLTLVGAVLLGAAPVFTATHLALNPDDVVARLELWQVFTYLFIPQPSPLSILFSMMIVLGMGSQLEQQWGTARLWRIIGGIGIATGVLTTLLSLVVPRLGVMQVPGTQMVTLVIWLAVGLLARRSQMNFWNLPVTGYTFAAIGLAFSLFAGLYGSWIMIIPDLIAAGLTFMVVHEGAPANWWLRFRSWQLDRDLKKRSAHLKGIDGGRRNVGGDSDKYLH
ncbi:MAG: rhomboid family intramembrane serine protease [Archangium sp.]|nr:rhomboid family intramembrane serine protease [Archangium sp.]MDP3575875.1 rhomboid family intramembrane serine protease [Archangium sp.]